jgi:Glycosyl hydrolases family 39
MSQPISQKKKRWPLIHTFALAILVCTACSSITVNLPLPPISHPLAPSTQKLPGEEIWKNGISSFLFGTNDTHEWAEQNLETQPAIQKYLRNAGFTVIRSFFQDNANDAAIEQRITAIENSGARCLGVIFNIFNVSYDEHLVQYLGNRCLIYEFGNEPDYNDISVETYLKQWNAVIPRLRHINPSATFIGPVASTSSGSFIQDFLTGVKSSGVLPDAISFHWYPCYHDSEEDCLNKADTAGQEALRIRSVVKNILGKDLPIGITEWNFDPGNPPQSYGDKSTFITSFSNAALQSMIQAGVAFACQFDAASFAGYGHLDMFNINNNAPKAQYYAIKSIIDTYRPSS